MPIRSFPPFGLLLLSLLGALCGPVAAFAQTDTSLLLRPERLGPQHILPRDFILKTPHALSATRTLEEVDQLPFTVWTVTADDILRFGFVTLGDVLRAAPGIRVSQPGNAVEGEMFLMRGLAGNQHVKVLINDVPITSNAAHGVTIGAQLPIRQAERIEVVYGPDGVLYGRLPDYHLSDLGLQMADRAAEALAGRDVSLIWSSPMERAQETAAPVAEVHDLPVGLDDRLLEATNVFEG
ncbi:MAG TPA: TonB-dependent receptor plug domain-containing protein, partial [Saprospiraceae bacterium]|nr:TonB-dependent receptor plug domain-containing protein [Saprospiraceae bacterium]